MTPTMRVRASTETWLLILVMIWEGEPVYFNVFVYRTSPPITSECERVVLSVK